MAPGGLDNFDVDWSPSKAQDFNTSPHERQATAYSPVKHFFQWQEFDTKGNTKPIGQRFSHLFFSGVDLPDGSEWRFERPLGKGSFGAAALFVKVDETQNVVDQFALKVADLKENERLNKYKPGLTHEAAIMAQTNAFKSDSVIRLRQFNVSGNYGRYYSEFCPYDSLESLRLKYKAWNTYLPEAFLWHIFYSLAEGCLKFSIGPFKNLASSRFGQRFPEAYLLHNDIKTENILLGSNITKDGKRQWYPVAKFADFGLSIITNPYEALRNTARFLQKGTRVWYPPGQRSSMMTDYKKYYFIQPGINSLRRDEHKILAQANIWAVGAVMWSLLTLDEIDDLSDRINDILMGKTRTFDGTNIVKRFHPGVNRRYSSELLEIVQACLRMRTQDRPSPQDLFRDVGRHLRQCQQNETERVKKTGNSDYLNVACAPSEISKLPDGGANFEKNEDFWRAYADHLLWIPQEADLPCPPSAPDELPVNINWPTVLRGKLTQRWASAIKAQIGQQSTRPLPLSEVRKRTASTAFPEGGEPAGKEHPAETELPSRKREKR
ncbi:hypothetical protein LTR20_002095 [Exophiala xenobiotica]|nr:hypothetical protein LTS13_004504 [Exophiala xenobiotica]KAK5400377.1 hypothetical protein LTR79_002478 [Exophiala xenobiotica]KAK5420682.1 hypothetical protein LTR90_003575 [Exophiala xenobiotica]KAK5469585.1 hypothetical protein LTR20_002095 [Exophiala xenobiotica]KAK5477450.1 hypothetical protein LTR26_008585 [Exophiala xenobiotica]